MMLDEAILEELKLNGAGTVRDIRDRLCAAVVWRGRSPKTAATEGRVETSSHFVDAPSRSPVHPVSTKAIVGR
jgi:hypothetical protein